MTTMRKSNVFPPNSMVNQLIRAHGDGSIGLVNQREGTIDQSSAANTGETLSRIDRLSQKQKAQLRSIAAERAGQGV